MDTALAHYAPLYDANITCDVVHPGQDLDRYRLVVVPNLYLVDEDTARNLTAYVRRGGHLLMSFFSGIAGPCDRVHPGRYPAPFRELLGLHIEEFWPLRQYERIGVAFTPPLPVPGPAQTTSGTLWSEVIVPEGAQVAARFTTGDLAGEPAVTRHRFGEGTAWYVGTRLDKNTMAALMAHVARGAAVEPVLPALPPGVEAVIRRSQDGDEILLLLNHRTGAVDVDLPEAMVDLLGDATPLTRLALPPRGVSVLRRA
jgi:beta-galactosidase